jgi:hypothetical protein
MFISIILLADTAILKQYHYCLRFQVLTAVLISLMMEAVRTTETSLYFNETTRHCNPEGYHLQCHYCTIHRIRMNDFTKIRIIK